MKRILLVGGGSGGHVFPLIAVANSLRERSRQDGIELELQLWGDGDFAKLAAQRANIPFRPLIASKLRRYFSFLNFIDAFKLIPSFFQSMWLMFWYMPDAVFSKGGYAAVMPAIAAKIHSVPVFTHESDSTPGLANRIIGRLADKIFISFESSLPYYKRSKTEVVGNPIMKELAGGDRLAALNLFNLSPERKTILVLGGSQGARRINEAILESIVQLTQKYQIIHQAGGSQFKKMGEEIEKYKAENEAGYGQQIAASYRLYSFLDMEQMKSAYAAADVIIARGGAGLLFEIALIGKPAIIIPLSLDSSRGDQIANAAEFAKYGASIIEESNLTPHMILNRIEFILKPENYSVISEKIRSFAKPDAADIIASKLLS